MSHITHREINIYSNKLVFVDVKRNDIFVEKKKSS